jgi:hypothetical protein
MELRRLDAKTYELYQARLLNTGLESSTRFAFREPHYVDATFECIPRLDKFPHAHLNLFWASYIFKPAGHVDLLSWAARRDRRVRRGFKA